MHCLNRFFLSYQFTFFRFLGSVKQKLKRVKIKFRSKKKRKIRNKSIKTTPTQIVPLCFTEKSSYENKQSKEHNQDL